MNKYLLALASMALLAGNAQAETVVFSENFDSSYSESFPNIYDVDALEPASNIRTLFIGTDGYYMPWWHLKDTSSSTDRYIGSHSHYSTPGTSSDWLGSCAIHISSEGFILSFDAQSYTLNGDENQLSDLWIFITDQPLDSKNLPTEVFDHIEKVPQGASVDNVEGDFTHYEYSLDGYIGQTIYINFANLNTDKDLLCLDNIKVARADIAELEIISAPSLITDDSYTVSVKVNATYDNNNWSVTLSDANGSVSQRGTLLAAGEQQTIQLSLPIQPGQTTDYTVAFESDEQTDLSKSGTVSRLAFEPFRKVLIEETTGMWCGWCPGGVNLIESMHADDDMSQYIVPVSVHINSDNLAMNAYGVTGLGINAAPLFYVNRTYAGGPSETLDYNVDKNLKGSIANTILNAHNTLTTFDLDLKGEWVISDGDTIAINCTATARPAINFDNANYKVGFILTENNVMCDQFYQTNYLSESGLLEPWSSLPEYVFGLAFNDVARKIDNFSGISNSLPTTLEAETDYTFSYKMTLPDTKIVSSVDGTILAPALQTDFCNIIAFIIDPETGTILNAADFPMSDIANDRYTTAKYVADLAGVDDVIVDNPSAATAEYFDLHGRRVANPTTPGLYILRQGPSTSKILLK